MQAEEKVRALHGSPGSSVGRRSPADSDPPVPLFWGGREAGGDVGRVEWGRRGHAAELGLQPRGPERALVAGVAGVGPAAARPQPRGHQPPRRQQPPLRGPAHLAELAPRGADPPRPRGHFGLIVTVDQSPGHDCWTVGRCSFPKCTSVKGSTDDCDHRYERDNLFIRDPYIPIYSIWNSITYECWFQRDWVWNANLPGNYKIFIRK